MPSSRLGSIGRSIILQGCEKMAKDLAGAWLKKNDPNYSKRHKSEYPYLTGRQIGRRSETEIPASCLDTYLVQEWTGMNIEQLREVQELFT